MSNQPTIKRVPGGVIIEGDLHVIGDISHGFIINDSRDPVIDPADTFSVDIVSAPACSQAARWQHIADFGAIGVSLLFTGLSIAALWNGWAGPLACWILSSIGAAALIPVTISIYRSFK